MSLIITKGYGEAIPDTFSVLSVTPYVDRVDVLFDQNVTLVGIGADVSNWTVTGGTVAVTVTSVSVSSATVSVYITEAHNGDSLTLTMPYAGIMWGTVQYNGTIDFAFTGVGVAPTLIYAVQETGTTIRVNFSEAVKADQATDAANWAMSGGYTVDSVTETSSSEYVLTLTSPLVASTSYTVTASNIEDLSDNPV